MMRKRWLGRRGATVAGIVLAGGLTVGGATAYAAGTDGSHSAAPTAAAKAHKHAGKHRHLRFRVHRMLARGVHGQATVKNAKTGQYVVREWQRGQVTSISGDRLTVKSPDGVSWTWNVDKNAKVTRDGKKLTESALKNGDTVLVVGKQSGGTNDAGRIFAPSAAQLAKMKAKAAAHGTKA
ncbi:DUF5666 domain-containing protein [Streptomyces mirabilis]|uniref:DUF5666 domain-containing protein n=1 Tax=Streptomyces mirabilis TaxID=68239 RepID=UPI00225A67F9|nr:DUF5666 domain-containing protein [Streptomyces mirabilis]MCX4419318.1 DUF5666 domain-containing protein [Streptomyces mirabilis]